MWKGQARPHRTDRFFVCGKMLLNLPRGSQTLNVLITGGAGFIGSNMTAHHLALGDTVTVYDNLSRPRTDHNLAWLRGLPNADRLRFVRGDIREFAALSAAAAAARPEL